MAPSVDLARAVPAEILRLYIGRVEHRLTSANSRIR